MKRILFSTIAFNVAELKAAIGLALVETRVAFKDQIDADAVLCDGLLVELEEDTLTDGSLVYNLSIESETQGAHHVIQ